MKVLYICGSARTIESNTHKYSELLIKTLKSENVTIELKERILEPSKIQGPDNFWIESNQTSLEQRTDRMRNSLSLSDKYIDELKWADLVIIGCPMYNFSIPWNVKAYIDNIVRVSKTFEFDPEENKFKTLLRGKKAILVTSSAGVYSSGPMQEFDFCFPYLKTVFGFININIFAVINLEGRWLPEKDRGRIDANANTQIKQIVDSLT